MPSPTSPGPQVSGVVSPQARAILLMIAAVTLFSVMDACAKGLSTRTGPVPAIWARYLGQTLLVLVLVEPRLRSVLRTFSSHA
jgi:hypothetical protein